MEMHIVTYTFKADNVWETIDTCWHSPFFYWQKNGVRVTPPVPTTIPGKAENPRANSFSPVRAPLLRPLFTSIGSTRSPWARMKSTSQLRSRQ